MFYVVLLGLGAWATVATVACVSVCMAAGRFNAQAEGDDDGGLSLGGAYRG